MKAGDVPTGERFRRLPAEDYVDKYHDWAQRVDRMHHQFVEHHNDPVTWTPLDKSLSESRVALVTTAGVHRRTDPPFDQMAQEGDPSVRVIGWEDHADDLMVSHNHFDHSDADRDVNCLFPIDRLRELADQGGVGSVSPVHFGFMGFTPDPAPLRRYADEAGRRLAEADVDVVVFTPG